MAGRLCTRSIGTPDAAIARERIRAAFRSMPEVVAVPSPVRAAL
jgi:hypothetical protein